MALASTRLSPAYEDDLCGINTTGQLVPSADVVFDGTQRARVWTMAGRLVVSSSRRRRRRGAGEGVCIVGGDAEASPPYSVCARSLYEDLLAGHGEDLAHFVLHFKWE